MVRDSVRSYCQEKLAPRIVSSWRNQATGDVREIMQEMGGMGMLGECGYLGGGRLFVRF